jgi:hypothetical protein
MTKKLKFSAKDIEVLKQPLAAKSNSVDEVELIHCLQFLTAEERVALVNELHRVMKNDAKAMVVFPCWSTQKAYCDLRVQWPPVVEGWLFALDAETRKQDPFPDSRYICDFVGTWGYGLHPAISSRNQEYQQHAVSFFKEAAQDVCATLICRKK